MSTFEVFEAKHRWSELLERAVGGEERVIRSKREAVARRLPFATPNPRARALALAVQTRRNRSHHRLGGVSMHDLVDEGRR
jgi:antitoxin (DNA-binding transcriptional repressor) of toxin-antitoxin stability system